jgi:hypothetical protein
MMKQGSVKPFVDLVGVMFIFNCGMHACGSALDCPSLSDIGATGCDPSDTPRPDTAN